MSKVKALFDDKLWKFLLVGVCNTLLSAAVIFLLYRLARFGYWGSTVIAYGLGSILSFFLNRSFTFGNRAVLWKVALKFAVTVAVCYVVAYSLAKPAVFALLSDTDLSTDWVEQIAMGFGIVLFTGLNYLGQRLFAFREKETGAGA